MGELRAAGADAIAVAVLAAVTAVVAGNRLAFDGWLARFDLYTFFVPWYAFLGERLRALEIPGWNPHLFSGTPFAGDPESGWMYLPAMLAFTLFDVLTGFKALAVLHLAIAALTTYALARVLGMGPVGGLVAAVAFVVGPLLQWSTYCCLVLVQFAVWMPLALLGVELALRAERWRERIVPWCATGFAVSQMFAGWVGQGWLNAPLLVAAYAGYRTLLSPPRPGRDPRRRLTVGAATGVAALGLGLALGAAGILPRLAVNAQSNLAGGEYTALGAAGEDTANPPWRLGYALVHLLGSGYEHRAAALGGAVVVLALLAPVIAGRRFAVPFFAALTLVAVTLALEPTPLHALVYVIPRFREMHEHDPWRIYTLAIIGPALLSGATIDRLGSWRGRRRLLPVVFAPLLLMALVAAVLRGSEGFVGWAPLVAAAVTTGLVAVAVAAPGVRRRRVSSAIAGAAPRGAQSPAPNPISRLRPAGLGGSDRGGWVVGRVVPGLVLVVILAQPVGLEWGGSWLGWPEDASWERHWRPHPWVARSLANEVSPRDPGGAGEFLQGRLAGFGPFRYVGYGGAGHPEGGRRAGSYMGRRFDPNIQAILVNGRPMFLGLYDIQGYNPVELARYAEFMVAVNGMPQDYHLAYLLPSGVRSPLLDLLDVRYLLVDATLPPFRADVAALTAGHREVFRTERVTVYERRPVPPHAWIVHDVRRVERGEALPLLTGGTIDPYQTALVEGPPPEVEPPTDPDGESTLVTRYGPDALTIATRTTAPGLLVVSEIYAEGWRASVDGSPVEIMPTHHVLRGVPIPAGEHTVELRYEPTPLRVGLVVSGVAFAGLVGALGVAGWRRGRRGRQITRG